MCLYTREMEEITAFIKGAISGEHCLGRCLYIHGVPGTGKVIWFLSSLYVISLAHVNALKFDIITMS